MKHIIDTTPYDTDTVQGDTRPVREFKDEKGSKCPVAPKLCNTCRITPSLYKKENCFTCALYSKAISNQLYNV